MSCDRYGCDGTHYRALEARDRRTGDVLRLEPISSEAEEVEAEIGEAPEGEQSFVVLVRCPECNPPRPAPAPAPAEREASRPEIPDEARWWDR